MESAPRRPAGSDSDRSVSPHAPDLASLLSGGSGGTPPIPPRRSSSRDSDRERVSERRGSRERVNSLERDSRERTRSRERPGGGLHIHNVHRRAASFDWSNAGADSSGGGQRDRLSPRNSSGSGVETVVDLNIDPAGVDEAHVPYAMRRSRPRSRSASADPAARAAPTTATAEVRPRARAEYEFQRFSVKFGRARARVCVHMACLLSVGLGWVGRWGVCSG